LIVRTFKEHRGVRIPQVERAGAFQLIRDPQVRDQVLDAVYSAHLGFDVVQTDHNNSYGRAIRPEVLSLDELQDAVNVLAAQKARLEQLQKQTVQVERDRIAGLQAAASDQLPKVLAGLRELAEKVPYFAGVLSSASDRAKDRANGALRETVNARDFDVSSPHSAGHVPDSLQIALDECTRELKNRTAVEQAENQRLREMLARAGISV
jgi:hypothetical protein